MLPYSPLEDVKAKVLMEGMAKQQGREFQALALNDVSIVEELDNKISFLKECQRLNLKATKHLARSYFVIKSKILFFVVFQLC